MATALAAAMVPLAGAALAPARAAEGDLDLPFGGGDGIATSPVPFGDFAAADQVVQPDGKIVVVGSTGAVGSRQVVVGRFLADGSPDPTFQGGGVFATDFGQTDIRATSVDLTIDDHIIVAGERGSGVGAPVFVSRLNPNGVGSDFYVEQLLPGGAGGYTLGGHAKVIPTSVFPFQRIAVGMWNESNRITVRLLDAFTGALATGSWTGGEAFADFGMRAVIQDLELSPDGSTISVSGHFGDFAANGFHHAGVGRIVTTTGAPDLSFAGDGTALYTLAPGTDDWAQSIAIDSAGRTLMAGNNFQGSIVATVARADVNGSLDPTFGGGDGIATYAFPVTGNTRAAAIAVDGADRPVVAAFGEGGVIADNFSALRFTTAGVLDTTFAGGDGVASYLTCGAGSSKTPALQDDGKVLLLGSCDGQIAIARFDGPALLENVALTVQPAGNVAASQLNLPLGEIDREQREALLSSAEALQAIQSSPLRNTPLRNTPLRNTPLRNTPLRNTPLRNTPLRNTPLRNTSLPPVLLSDAPLLRPGGWTAVLNDPSKMGAASPLLGLPPQSVTFLQLPDSALEGITLEDIDLSATPLRNTSVAATLFGATPLQNLPAPSSQGWCAYLAGQPFSCANGVNLATTTLFDLEAAGDDLSGLFSQPLPITATTLHADSPILDIRLNDMELVDTPIGDIQYDQLAGADRPLLFACTSDCTDAHLATMQEDFADGDEVNPDATLSTVFQVLPSFQLTFGQLLLGIVAADEMPYEELPLEALLGLQDADMATYFVDFDIACSASSNVVVDVDLPDGFEPIDGTATKTVGEITSAVGAPTLLEGNVARYSLGASPLCGTGNRHIILDFLAEMPSHTLAIHDASATVSSASVSPVTARGADLRFVDGEDPEFEPDKPISSDVLYTGHISGAGDVDAFVLPAPAEGSTVEVMLSNLPADYDLVLYGSDDPDATPLRNTPLRNTPLRNTPLRNTPVGDEGLAAAADGGLVEVAPETLQDVPLRNTPLRNTSLHRDLSNEKVTTSILESDVGHELTIQVSGFNGASSDLPYVLRVRVIPPEADLECMPARNLGSAGTPGTLPAVSAVPATTKSLFLVNKDRLGDLYGSFDADTDWGTKVAGELSTLAARPDVQGVVLPVEGDAAVAAAYAAWDTEPCSVEAANDVVAAINAVVDGYRSQLSELRHIVLVGADEALPLARLADRTTLSNQRDYRTDAAIGGVDNPISRAFARGYLLSDDPFGDFDPSEFLDGKLFLPDVGLGRLVEHPQEIVSSIDRYEAANGQLDLSTSFTAGYDFLKDGATEVDAALRREGQGGPSSLINDTWTRQDVIDAWNGVTTVNGAPNQVAEPKAVSVNAHYDHYRALPAIGDSSGDAQPELLSTADLTAAGLPLNALLFGMGCQGGLNIPDVFATLGNEAKAADWAQTATQQGGLYAGNTGYGYGDTDVSAYSERLYANFAEGLDGTVTIGQAMTLAKNRYIRGLGAAGVYDAKAVEEAVFYGLPMFRLGVGEGGSLMPAPQTPAPPAPLVQESTFDTEPVTTPVEVDRGTYYVVPGQDPQVTHYRPIQPRMELPIPAVTGLRAHGALLEEITTKDISAGTGVDPVYSLPTRDLAANEPEPDIDGGIFPTTLQNVTHTATATGRQDTLVLLPGQFFNTLDDGYADGLGVQRLFTDMDGRVFQSDSDDFEPATIEEVTAHTLGGSAVFSMRVDDLNATRAVVLYLDDAAAANPDGSFTWKRAELTESPTEPGLWLGFGPLAAGSVEITQWMGQVVDDAGNVAVTTNKGRYFEGGPLPLPQADGIEIELSGTPRADGTFAPGVVASPVAPEGLPLERSVDGGAFRANASAVTFDQPGVHSIAYRGADGSYAERTLVVTDVEEALEINVTVPAPGQEVLVGSTVVPAFTCLGPAVTCTASMSPLDTTPGAHTVTFTATSARGQTETVSRTYYARYAFDGFFSPINNAPTYNTMKAGSTVPAKFTLSSASGAVSDLAAVATISSKRVDCVSGAPADAIESTTTGITSALHYDVVAGQYVYTWKTAKTWANTCRMLSFTFNDGATEYALFQLK